MSRTGPFGRLKGDQAGDMTEDRNELQHLLEKVYRERGFDFREYRESTLTRRLGRRLRARGAETYADYARVLDQDPTEYDRLFNDLTINVTSFFRDDVAFKALEEVVLPALIGREEGETRRKGDRDRERGSPCPPVPPSPCLLRIWSAGCATGEEPYSIAMLLLETLGTRVDEFEITVLATDIDAKALDRAREGVFGPKDVEGIRPAWLERYFVAEGEAFRVRPALRQLVTFEVHNLVSDPPYRDLDLVVCRNVLIYFAPALQTRVLKGFHEGLREGGFLLLGKAEVPVGETRGLFHCVDRKAKLYRKAI